MWWNIIKNVKTVSQTQGSFDFEEEEIPEEEDDSCSKELKRLFDKAKNHPNATNVRLWRRFKQDIKKPKRFPQYITCAILKELKELKYSEDDPASSYDSMVKIIGEKEEDKVAIYATFSPRGFFFTVEGVSEIQSQRGLEIVVAEGYGKENEFR